MLENAATDRRSGVGIARGRHRFVVQAHDEGVAGPASPFVASSVRRAFTLTELLVAVVMLIAVLLAISKIFSTTSKVASTGEATTDVLQETAAIARQLSADFDRLSTESLFLIRCMAVPNDVNGNVLLNPSLPPNAMIRSDQLLYFTNGLQNTVTFRPTEGTNQKGQGTVARVYFGHGYSLGEAGLPVDFQGDDPRSFDPLPLGGRPLYPWSSRLNEPPLPMTRTPFDGPGIFSINSAGSIDMPPTSALQWLLVRQPAILVDDDATDGGEQDTVYLGQVLVARSVFLYDQFLNENSLQFLHGRADAAASQLNDIRSRLMFLPNGNARTWDEQRALIVDPAGGLLYHPRAERSAPGPHRVDQALTNQVVGSACSSVKIDWAWDDGTGRVGNFNGYFRNPENPQPWFGMPEPAALLNGNVQIDTERGVGAYADPNYRTFMDYQAADTILPVDTLDNNVERVYTAGFGGSVAVYEAFFGWNKTVALNQSGNPDVNLAYTPWPNAIRVTLTLHDPKAKLEAGREVQFVIRLPRRGPA